MADLFFLSISIFALFPVICGANFIQNMIGGDTMTITVAWWWFAVLFGLFLLCCICCCCGCISYEVRRRHRQKTESILADEEQGQSLDNNNSMRRIQMQPDASEALVKTTVHQHISTTPTSPSGVSEPTPLQNLESPVPHIVGSPVSKMPLSKTDDAAACAVNDSMLYAGDRDELPFIVRAVSGTEAVSYGTAYPRIPSHAPSISNLVIDEILKKPKMNRLSVTHTLPAQKSLAVHVLETATEATTEDRSSHGGSGSSSSGSGDSSGDTDDEEDEEDEDGTGSSSGTTDDDDDGETDGDGDDDGDGGDDESHETASKLSKKSSRIADVLSQQSSRMSRVMSRTSRVSALSKAGKAKHLQKPKHIKVTVIKESMSDDDREVKENASEAVAHTDTDTAANKAPPAESEQPHLQHRTTNTLSSIRDRIALVQKNMVKIRSPNGSGSSGSVSISHPLYAPDEEADADLYDGGSPTDIDQSQNVQLTKLKLGHANSLEKVKQNMAFIKNNSDAFDAKSK